MQKQYGFIPTNYKFINKLKTYNNILGVSINKINNIIIHLNIIYKITKLCEDLVFLSFFIISFAFMFLHFYELAVQTHENKTNLCN